jgi:hypothetical protein
MSQNVPTSLPVTWNRCFLRFQKSNKCCIHHLSYVSLHLLDHLLDLDEGVGWLDVQCQGWALVPFVLLDVDGEFALTG